MKRLISLASIAFSLSSAISDPITAQIAVEGGSGYNSMSISSPSPQSGDISSSGDLFLSNDLELGSQLYVNGEIFMDRREFPSPTIDQFIYFGASSLQTAGVFGYDADLNKYILTGDLRLFGGHLSAELSSTEDLYLEADDTRMRFLIDANADDDAGANPHLFTWYNNNYDLGSRAMELRSTGPSPDLGNLTIAGTLTSNGFDLAEMFLAAEEIVPGDLVAVDDSRPDAVRPAVAGDGGRILGIVATRPGVILGGSAFSPDALRRQWGDEIADVFERERPTLEAEVYAENPALHDMAATLVSEGAFVQALESRQDVGTPMPGRRNDDGEPRDAAPARILLDETEIQESYTAALLEHETQLYDAILAKFQERRFARVALSGRVPVQVDASFGPIEAGDPLTASPIPGVAMKAEAAGWMVGTALEAMPSGSGTILAFVDRHWFGGDGLGRLAALETELQTLKVALAALGLSRDELRASVASRSRVDPTP